MKTELDIKSAVGRWTRNRFNLRSSFYTGRGVNSGDLNSTMLEEIYQGIKAAVGQNEATNFAKFVDNLKDLTASAFIQAFEQFWYGGCQQTLISQGEQDGNRITGHGETRDMGAFVLIAEALGGRRSSPAEIENGSRAIKSVFVHDHRNEIG